MCVLIDFFMFIFEWFLKLFRKIFLKKVFIENMNGFGVFVWVVIVFVGFYKVIVDWVFKYGLVVVFGYCVG